MPHVPDARLLVLDDPQALTVALYGECRGSSLAAQVATAVSIRNRVRSGKWYGGDDYKTVILRWAQFSCLWPTLGGANFERVMEFATKIKQRGLTGLANPIERQLAWVAQGVISGALHEDPTKGATHYFDDSIAPPAWAKAPAKPALVVDRLHFWANVA